MIRDEHREWPVTQRRVMAEGIIWDMVSEDVTTPSGESMTREFVTHPGAVAVVAWDEERDAVACLRQYRHPVRLEMVEVPAGLLDVEGEEWLPAAQRELAEEVELAAERWQVLVDMCTTPGGNQESLRIYLARDVTPAPRPEGFVLEGEEAHMSWDWVPRTDLVEAVLDGRLQSPTLVAGVLALETARLSGRLDALRAPDADWPIRGH